MKRYIADVRANGEWPPDETNSALLRMSLEFTIGIDCKLQDPEDLVRKALTDMMLSRYMEVVSVSEMESMKVHLIYDPNRGDSAPVRVHKEGCQHISGDKRHATSDYVTVVFTQREAAEDFHVDFISEGSMTRDAAFDYTDFLPCTRGLPVG